MSFLAHLPLGALAIAAVCAAACALPGTFLVLRRYALLGDALSHAVLPGVIGAYLLAGDRGGPMTLLGAALVGVLTTLATEWIRSKTRTEESAALGVVFSTLFAIGLVLVARFGRKVDLDLDCVLFGALETSLYRQMHLGPLPVPALALGPVAALLLGGAFVALFFKELRLAAFDPALARASGFRPDLLNLASSALTAATCVACFRVVGSVLVLAMLVVPACTALLLTRRLGAALLLSMLLAALCAPLGWLIATRVPAALHSEALPFRTAPLASAMGVASGLLLALAILFAPRRGVLAGLWHRHLLRQRIALEDALAQLLRAEERKQPASEPAPKVLARLRRQGLVEAATLRLTPAGRIAATELLRTHRLWESYLHTEANLPHLHEAAHRLEHAPPPATLADEAGRPQADPHGRPIP